MRKKFIIKDIVTNTYLNRDCKNNTMVLEIGVEFVMAFDEKNEAERLLNSDLMNFPEGKYEIIEIFEN